MFIGESKRTTSREDMTGSKKMKGSSPPSSVQLVQMKERFPSETDWTLHRYLVAREFDLEEATSMLQESKKWRQENLPIKREEVQEELDKKKWVIGGRDLEGQPIVYYRVRYSDPKIRDLDTACRAVIYFIEELINREEPHAQDHMKVTLIFDRSEFKREYVDMELFKALSKRLNEHYPERCNLVLIYPVDAFLRFLWTVAKVFLPKRTLSKVKMLGSRDDLLDYIDINELHIDLGGKNATVLSL